MVAIDIEDYKKEGFSYEEFQDIVNFDEKNAYDLDDAFILVKNKLFSKKEEKCIK